MKFNVKSNGSQFITIIDILNKFINLLKRNFLKFINNIDNNMRFCKEPDNDTEPIITTVQLSKTTECFIWDFLDKKWNVEI